MRCLPFPRFPMNKEAKMINKRVEAIFKDINIKVDNKKIILCSSFVMIEDILLSRNYSSSFMDDLTWRRYLVLQLRADAKKGYTYGGHKEFRKYKNCIPDKYKEVMNRLKELELINILEPRHTFTYKYLFLAPIWDQDRNLTIKTVDAYKTTSTIRANNISFTIVPKDCLAECLKDDSLSVTHIRLLLKLYKYNNLSIFEGVDPNAIHVLEDELIIHPRILHDLSISYEETVEYLEDLSHYYLWQEREVYTETFDMDSRLMLHSKDKGARETKLIKVLTPIYQHYSSKEEK